MLCFCWTLSHRIRLKSRHVGSFHREIKLECALIYHTVTLHIIYMVLSCVNRRCIFDSINDFMGGGLYVCYTFSIHGLHEAISRSSIEMTRGRLSDLVLGCMLTNVVVLHVVLPNRCNGPPSFNRMSNTNKKLKKNTCTNIITSHTTTLSKTHRGLPLKYTTQLKAFLWIRLFKRFCLELL